jgi:hypothetical protein
MAAGNVDGPLGAVAQLVERIHGMDEAAGSKPAGSTSTIVSPWALGGFVAGEGTFVNSPIRAVYRDGTPRRRFVFQVTVASRDRAMLEAIRAHLRFGSIRDMAAEREHWQPRSEYTVNSRQAHFLATIPFMERYLLPSAKRAQYERWRDALLEHERAHPSKFGKGPSPCSEPGCDKPVRGRGLCRSHYYRATGY